MSLMEKAPEARPGSLQPVNDANITWLYIAPAGTTLEMCQAPTYWHNVTRECGQQRVPGKHAWNKIEILAEDGSWEADLRVTSVEGNLVHTRTLRVWHQTQKPSERLNPPKGYTVEHVPGNGWRALDATKTIITQKLATEGEATRAAIDHAKKAKGD